ncbi:MAG: XdhC family protein [Candidatus Bathyarchaeia archaeon]
MADEMEILSKAVQLLGQGKKVALCTIIDKKGSGPRDVGGKMVVVEDGEIFGTIGGGSLERTLINESLKALKEGKAKKVVFSLHRGEQKTEAVETGLICGGELTIFIDVIEPRPRLVIIGAGHVAHPLAKMADIAGFNVVVADDNEDLASRERFPTVAEILTGDFNEILDKVEVGARDFVVIVHGEPEHDYLALKKMIEKRPAYLGLLGSRAKVATLVNRLKGEGVSSEMLKILHAPVGIDIGAQTPEEIGISILAEIISYRRKAANNP